jgi:hypothetical protein
VQLASDATCGTKGTEPLAFWMQTTGATLLVVEWCSLVRVPMAAQDGRSVHGLLYLAAVRDGRCELEHGQGRIDTDALRRVARTLS